MTRKQRQEAMAAEISERINEEIDNIVAPDAAQITEKADEAQADAEEQARIDYLHRFYNPVYKSKWDSWELEISLVGINDILKHLGFFRYDFPEGGSTYVHIENNIISQVDSQNTIVDAFWAYIHKLPDRTVQKMVGDDWLEKTITSDMIEEKMTKQIGYYFSALSRLIPDDPIRILEDTRLNKYISFNNGIVRVWKGGWKFYPYSQMSDIALDTNEDNGQYVWRRNVLDRDFIETTEIGDYEKFCKYICGWDKDREEKTDTYCNRFKALRSIIGYLMHNNFECTAKSILFIDVNKDHMGQPAGGTGKGLIGKGLCAMINRHQEIDVRYLSVGGKGFNPTFDRRYSQGDNTTQLVHIEDISDDFNFRDFFNDVTDGAEFRKCGENTNRHMIKTMLSSNVPLDISAPSCKRRLIVFELDNYFGTRRTPIDVFGHSFFKSEWTKKDWAEFDNFMIRCCFLYMGTKDEKRADGRVTEIIEPPLINYKQQLLNSKLSEDFIKWFKDKIDTAVYSMKYVEYVKTTLFDEFVKKYQEYDNRQKYARAFTKWCKFYLYTMEIPSGEKRSTQDLLILYPPNNDKNIDYIFNDMNEV